MKKRPIVGTITILAVVPFLAFLIYFTFRFWPSLLNSFLFEKSVLGILGVFSGVLLWRGSVWGYRAGIVAWMLIALYTVIDLLALHHVWGTPAVRGNVAVIWESKDAIYMLLSIAVLYVLVRDVLQKNISR